MKIKDGEDFIISIFVFIFVLPLAILVLLFKLFSTPFDYVKYKKSRYQLDFPHRYTWLSEPHKDNIPYTVIKENEFPIEYIKWSEDYATCGYFVYKNVLLDFTEPFLFDEERKIFIQLQSEIESEENGNNETSEEDNIGKCLALEEAKELMLARFRANVPNRECNRIVFFCSRKKIERDYKEAGLSAMRKLEDFIIYEKGKLADAVKDFLDKVA